MKVKVYNAIKEGGLVLRTGVAKDGCYTSGK